ncbi:MAG: hypothetical protein EBV23_09005 [Flavobacteriia bacterium]|nr:hypothetical protein [Flavobacteriia bacterium]
MNQGQVVITSPESGPMAPEPTNEQSVVTSDNTSNRPEWLPEKFNSPDELAKAYQELESKLGQRGQFENQPQQEEQLESQNQLPPDFSHFGKEYMDNGRLSDQSYKELESRGIPKDVVDAYIAGQQALQEREVGAVMNDIGGTENFQALSKWASENLSQTELDAYNSMVLGGNLNQARMAVKGLYAQYSASTSQPNLLGGVAGRSSGSDGFRSTQEVIQAMKDPRYKTDEAYRTDVQSRLAVSNII